MRQMLIEGGSERAERRRPFDELCASGFFGERMLGVLRTLIVNGPSTRREIAHALKVEPGGLCEATRRLTDEGIICKGKRREDAITKRIARELVITDEVRERLFRAYRLGRLERFLKGGGRG